MLCPLPALLSLQRLTEAIAYARHLEDVSGGLELLLAFVLLRELSSVGEATLGRDQQPTAFVAISEELEEKFRADSTE